MTARLMISLRKMSLKKPIESTKTVQKMDTIRISWDLSIRTYEKGAKQEA